MRCHKNRMTTRYITFWRVHVTSKRVRDNVAFSTEIMSTLKTIKSTLKRSYDKQDLTLVVSSYEMTTSVRSSIYRLIY